MTSPLWGREQGWDNVIEIFGHFLKLNWGDREIKNLKKWGKIVYACTLNCMIETHWTDQLQ